MKQSAKSRGGCFGSDFVMMFAPKAKTKEDIIIFRYLVKTYDELYRIVERHTEYRSLGVPLFRNDVIAIFSNSSVRHSFAPPL